LSLALWASAIVAFANIAMTLLLLAVYIGTYRRIRSSFTLGLVLFGVFFVILSLSILVFWLFLFQNVNVSSATTLVDQASFYMLLVNVGEALAISNLLGNRKPFDSSKEARLYLPMQYGKNPAKSGKTVKCDSRQESPEIY